MTWATGVATGYINFMDQLQALLCDTGHAFGLVYSGTGNGTLTGTTGVPGGYTGGSASAAETFTITATSSSTFQVVGSLAGDIGTATVDQPFITDRVAFRINGGTTPFAVGDAFKLSTSPPWSLVRRHGALPSMRFSDGFANPSRLWDNQAGTGSNAQATAATLPASAGFSMIGPADVRRVNVSIYDVPSRYPTAFRVEYSDDGQAWQTAATFTGIQWSNTGESRTFNVPSAGQHLYWRAVFTASTSGQVEITELRFLKGTTGDIELHRRPEWIVSAPGNDGLDAIFLGVELYEDAAVAARSFNFYQFRAYDPQVMVRSQGANSGLRNVPLTSNNFNWWAAVNGRRITGVAKIGAVYVPFYQGLGKPYELPSVHPYPAINAGTGSDADGVATSTSPNFRGFSSPGQYGMVARYPDGVWRPHSNRYSSGGDAGDGSTRGKVYPAALNNGGRLADFREALDGTRVLYEIVLTSNDPRHMWGELDGCYFTPGFNLVPETTIRMDGFDHLVFQNTFRNAAADFFAIRQD